MDASIVIPGAGEAGAAATGAKSLATVGRALDPVAQALKVAKAPIRATGKVGRVIQHLESGASETALHNAVRAGAEGGENGQVFRSQMMEANAPRILEKAQRAFHKEAGDRSTQYVADMVKARGSSLPDLDVGRVQKAVADAKADIQASNSGTGWSRNHYPEVTAALDQIDNDLVNVAREPRGSGS